MQKRNSVQFFVIEAIVALFLHFHGDQQLRLGDADTYVLV